MTGLLTESPGNAVKTLLASTGRALVLREASDGKDTTAWTGAAQLGGGEVCVLGARNLGVAKASMPLLKLRLGKVSSGCPVGAICAEYLILAAWRWLLGTSRGCGTRRRRVAFLRHVDLQ